MRSRRQVLEIAGLGGVTLAIGSVAAPIDRLVAPAFAQTPGDGEIAAFLESVELAAVEAYALAAQPGRITTPGVAETLESFSAHHLQHALDLGVAAGVAATGTANPRLLERLRDGLEETGSENEVLRVLFDLENAAAATDLFALGKLELDPARELTASILPIESQHAVVIGELLELDSDDLLPAFETEDLAWDPDGYPVAE